MKKTRHQLLIGFLLLAAGIGSPDAAGAESPFLGAYIHLPTWFHGQTDDAGRHRAIVENLDRFQAAGLRVLIPFVTTTGCSTTASATCQPC